MPWGTYENKVKKIRCPLCGVLRPDDWYRGDHTICWLCRSTERGRGYEEALKARKKEGFDNELLG